MADSSKKMTLVGLTTLVAVNMMGSGIIMLPASMAQIGAVSLLSWGVLSLEFCPLPLFLLTGPRLALRPEAVRDAQAVAECVSGCKSGPA